LYHSLAQQTMSAETEPEFQVPTPPPSNFKFLAPAIKMAWTPGSTALVCEPQDTWFKLSWWCKSCFTTKAPSSDALGYEFFGAGVMGQFVWRVAVNKFWEAMMYVKKKNTSEFLVTNRQWSDCDAYLSLQGKKKNCLQDLPSRSTNWLKALKVKRVRENNRTAAIRSIVFVVLPSVSSAAPPYSEF